MLVLGDVKTPGTSGEGDPTEGLQFPAVSFRYITAVTNNFHESFMIGQGGFGKVYRVIHPHIFHVLASFFSQYGCLNIYPDMV